MKILHIGKYYAPFSGGIENAMRQLMNKQLSRGHSVSAIVHSHEPGTPYSTFNDNGIRIYRMWTLAVVLFVPIALFAFKTMRRVLINERPDVLHCHMPNVSCFWLLCIARARNIPWVVHWHSDVIGEKPDLRIRLLYPLYRLFEQWLLSRAKKIIVTSPNYLNSSEPLSSWKSKCEIVPLGIEQRPNDIKRDSESSNFLNVLCVGRFTYYKGHQYLIDAVSKARGLGFEIRLHLVGTGELETELRNRVARLNIDSSVTFHGWLPTNKLSLLMYQSDVFCLPSIERTEAFGLVLLEAMQMKKPCIVTNVRGSGMSHVVKHQKTGLVVRHSDADALANALIECKTNPNQLSNWGQSGFDRLQSHFLIDKIAIKIEKIYQSLAD